MGWGMDMARPMNRLSARKVATLSEPGLYADGGGLYLRVTPGGTKSWIFRYRRHGRLHDMGLGPLHTVSLASAREIATEQRRLLLDSTDPIDARRSAQAAAEGIPTVRAAAQAYIEQHRHGWKNAKHAQQWANTMEGYVYPRIGDRPVDQVTTEDVLGVLRPIWTKKAETATRVRQRLETVLDAAFAARHWDRLNPARWRGHLDKLLPAARRVAKVKHFTAMPYRDVPAFMATLRTLEGSVARGLQFAILCASRPSEVRFATGEEISGDVWSIPAERMKAAREHVVPLSTEAMALLAGAGPGLLFPHDVTGRPLSENAFRQRLLSMGLQVTAHGFRSTFRDWAAETTDFPAEVVEMALAHSIKSKTEAAYRRGNLLEKRRVLMEAWAAHCMSALKQ